MSPRTIDALQLILTSEAQAGDMLTLRWRRDLYALQQQN